MKRWNGWGEERITFPFPETARQFLAAQIGAGRPLPAVTLEEAAAGVPASRLPAHPLVHRGAEGRLRHARGQSFPDWVALRTGEVDAFPDGVCYPGSREEVRELLRYARRANGVVIPYGGGTSVVGQITVRPSHRPVLSMDMSRMNRLVSLDRESLTATFEAGVAGPELEAQLRARGYTLGHFPQSFEWSTLGGWVATRSSGQQSMGYGRIEQLFAGGEMETPSGPLVLPCFPASAAGPDLREVVLGSEGRLGVLTRVSVRVRRLPPKEQVYAVFFPRWQPALTAVHRAVQERIPLSLLRLSNSRETQTQLAMGGRPRLTSFFEKLLESAGAGSEKCMVMFAVAGTKPRCGAVYRQTRRVFTGRTFGFFTGRYLGRKWTASRFRLPYLRNTLWEKGYGVDTFETAVDWHRVEPLMNRLESVLTEVLAAEHERGHIFTHLSHVYPQGASVYTTCIFRLGRDRRETLERWRQLKQNASDAIVSAGGTISHQHGVGTDHAPYLTAEKGRLGVGAIAQLCRYVDPRSMMNPGKLLP